MNRKQIIAITVLGILALGCSKDEEDAPELTKFVVIGDSWGLKPKPTPTRELTSEEKKIVGTYIRQGFGTERIILLDNGIMERWGINGRVDPYAASWSIVGNELRLEYHRSEIYIYRINTDNSITRIANIWDGKQERLPKEKQLTYKKIN